MCLRILQGLGVDILVGKTQGLTPFPVLDSHPMLARKTRSKFLWITALLLATLACRAATRLVIPDTPTPRPTGTNTPTATQTPTALPTLTPTVLFEAACPVLFADVLSTTSSEITLLPDRSDLSFDK